MKQVRPFDLVVIGAGTGGLTVARLVARAGKRVALIERDRPGGDCLWSGCVPTKALVQAAKWLHDATAAARFGVITTGVTLDFEVVRRHVHAAQEATGAVDSPEAIASWGVTLLRGDARFTAPYSVEVVGEAHTITVRARSFVIATGSHPRIPTIPGLEEVPFDTNVGLLAWETLPRSLAILGGGPAGVELAQIMARFGVRVTLLERLPRLLATEEPDASALIEQVLVSEGVEVRRGATVSRVDSHDRLVRIWCDGESAPAAQCERLVVATGRVASHAALGLAAAGVRASAAGIQVDANLRTSQSRIFAIGDVTGGPQFTHVAEDQARTVARTLISSGRRHAKWANRVVPRVTFSDPEVASVGLTASEAKRLRHGVRTWRLPLSAVDRAVISGETKGFLQLVTADGWQRFVPGLASLAGDEVVGACIVAPHAGELLVPVVMTMRLRLPVGMLAWNMQAYPTLGLGVRQVAGMPFETRV